MVPLLSFQFAMAAICGIQQCLDKYIKPKQLEGYKCEQCSQPAEITVCFDLLPTLLDMHLLPYSLCQQDQCSQKVGLLPDDTLLQLYMMAYCMSNGAYVLDHECCMLACSSRFSCVDVIL